MSCEKCKNCKRKNLTDGDYCQSCLDGPKCETENCGLPREPGLRFCRGCKKVNLDLLRRSGQILPVPPFIGAWSGVGRGQDAKENVRETKHGAQD